MYRLKKISPFSNTNLCSSASVSWRYDTARVCCWGPLLRRRRCRSIFSAHVTHSSNPPRTAAAVDRRDRQTDRLTDTVPLHRSIADYAISVNNFEPRKIQLTHRTNIFGLIPLISCSAVKLQRRWRCKAIAILTVDTPRTAQRDLCCGWCTPSRSDTRSSHESLHAGQLCRQDTGTRAFQFGQKKMSTRFDSILDTESIFSIRFDSAIWWICRLYTDIQIVSWE